MAQLNTKIKKLYYFFFYYNSISISTARTDVFYGLCAKDKHAGIEQRSTHKASILLLRFNRKNFFHYTQYISVITYKTLIIEL